MNYNLGEKSFDDQLSPDLIFEDLPAGFLVSKFERTNCETDGQEYNDYSRAVMQNWGPDTILFESDLPQGPSEGISGRIAERLDCFRGLQPVYRPEECYGFSAPNAGYCTNEVDLHEGGELNYRARNYFRPHNDSECSIPSGNRNPARELRDARQVIADLQPRLKIFSQTYENSSHGLPSEMRRKYGARKVLQCGTESRHGAIDDESSNLLGRGINTRNRQPVRIDDNGDGELYVAVYDNPHRGIGAKKQPTQHAMSSQDIAGGLHHDSSAVSQAAGKMAAQTMGDAIDAMMRCGAEGISIDTDGEYNETRRRTAAMLWDLNGALSQVGGLADHVDNFRGTTLRPRYDQIPIGGLTIGSRADIPFNDLLEMTQLVKKTAAISKSGFADRYHTIVDKAALGNDQDNIGAMHRKSVDPTLVKSSHAVSLRNQSSRSPDEMPDSQLVMKSYKTALTADPRKGRVMAYINARGEGDVEDSQYNGAINRNSQRMQDIRHDALLFERPTFENDTDGELRGNGRVRSAQPMQMRQYIARDDGVEMIEMDNI